MKQAYVLERGPLTANATVNASVVGTGAVRALRIVLIAALLCSCSEVARDARGYKTHVRDGQAAKAAAQDTPPCPTARSVCLY